MVFNKKIPLKETALMEKVVKGMVKFRHSILYQLHMAESMVLKPKKYQSYWKCKEGSWLVKEMTVFMPRHEVAIGI